MGQVIDAYEANEISFRYGDKTAVGLHKSAAPPVSWLSLAGTLLLWNDVLLDRLLPCHWTGIHLALWAVDSETNLTTLVTVVRPGDPR